MNLIKPVYDLGSPRPFAGALSASLICDLLEINFVMWSPCETVIVGWGNEALKPQPFVGEWDLTAMDRDGLNTQFSFHVITDDIPVIISLDAARFALQNNILNKPFRV